MKVYLSGAISSVVPGLSREELKERFHTAKRNLEDLFEWDIVNPIEVKACEDQHCVLNDLMQRYPDQQDFEVGYNEHTWACWMKYDLKAMLECDAIYLLKDWEKSRGAQLEFMVATNCGLQVMFQ